jgi:hypothetical protein
MSAFSCWKSSRAQHTGILLRDALRLKDLFSSCCLLSACSSREREQDIRSCGSEVLKQLLRFASVCGRSDG